MPATEQELLSGSALVSFRLNGQFLVVAEELARPVGLTAAWWQVLGAVLREPLSVAGIGREMGVSRQSVQRIADLLARRGLVEYRDNPSHRRAKLVAATDEGIEAVRAIDPAHAAFAGKLSEELGRDELEEVLAGMEKLSAALERLAEPAEGD